MLRDAPRAPPQTEQGCVPAAEQRCREGDVWLLDSCGRPEEKLDECESRACLQGECEPPPTTPCLDPPEGRCDGDVVRLCLAGRALSIDCKAKGLRCGQGEEGATCRPLVPNERRCSTGARCEGDVLLRCDDGELERVDCSALRARCMAVAGVAEPACVQLSPLDLTSCGPCGCPDETKRRESRCDGRDEDRDDRIDESLDCGAVPVVAFVVSDERGETSHAREDVEAELAALNETVARTEVEGGLTFQLADIVQLAEGRLRELDHDEFLQLLRDPRIRAHSEAFYIPILFTDVVLAEGETPKPGVSTLPNGTCGSMQQGYGPELGLVAVAKARYPTTVAHEVGHFLGLCHTHDEQAREPFLAYDARGVATTCEPSCRGQGDGICDTPFDPGPQRCSHDERCNVACSLDALPDTTNLMSYYAACRLRFSEEQLRLMQHTAAQRRAMHRCLGGNCPCQLGDERCPLGMSCRPQISNTGAEVARCALDGPRRPGADCQTLQDCGGGAICMRDDANKRTRCVRPCLESSDGCACLPAGPDLSVCREDLR